MEKDFKKDLDELFNRDDLLTKEVEVVADADCSLYCDGGFISDLNAGVSKTVRVSAGKHTFVFSAAGEKRRRTVDIGDGPNRVSVQGLKTLSTVSDTPTPQPIKPTQDNIEITRLSDERGTQNTDVINAVLFIGNILFLVAGIVCFIIAISSYQYRGDLMVVPTSFDPWGWIGFGLLCVSLCLSLACLARNVAHSFSVVALLLSLLVGGVCLYDSIEEDTKVGNRFYGVGQPSFEGYYDNHRVTKSRNSIRFEFSTSNPLGFDLLQRPLHQKGNSSIPFQIPQYVYLYEGVQHPNSSIAQTLYSIPNSETLGGVNAMLNQTPYYSIDFLKKGELTIYNLKPNTSYWLRLEPPGIYTSYGLFNLFEFYSKPNVVDYPFSTSY